MAAFLHQPLIINEAFILERLDTEAKKLIEAGRQLRQTPKLPDPWFKRTFRPIYQFFRSPNYRRETFLKFLLNSSDYQALQVDRFRQGGEIHQWIYDSYSLQRLLDQCGFTQIVQRTATTSYAPDWSSFNLDTEPDGSIYKPDSLFIEAIKPSA